jgi:hypothetical protein
MHKGFKCLDPSEGRVYISRDVVFDELVFPFSRLHPNAGARLRAELSVLLILYITLTLAMGMQFCLTIVIKMLHLLTVHPALVFF